MAQPSIVADILFRGQQTAIRLDLAPTLTVLFVILTKCPLIANIQAVWTTDPTSAAKMNHCTACVHVEAARHVINS